MFKPKQEEPSSKDHVIHSIEELREEIELLSLDVPNDPRIAKLTRMLTELEQLKKSQGES